MSIEFFASGKIIFFAGLAFMLAALILRSLMAKKLVLSRDSTLLDIKDGGTIYVLMLLAYVYSVAGDKFALLLKSEFGATQFYLALFSGALSAIEAIWRRGR
jgi:hypothetical protein